MHRRAGNRGAGTASGQVTGQATRQVTGLLLALLLALTAGTAGCALVDGRHRVGQLLGSWSQGRDKTVPRFAPKDLLVIDDNAARDRFLRRAPHDDVTANVRAADLGDAFLVVGSYNRCKQRSRVWMDTDRTAVWLEVYVPRADRNVNCYWAPLTVDVWLVSDDELGDVRAEDLRTTAPR